MKQLRIVAENNKGRRTDSGLRCIINFKSSSAVCRRRNSSYRVIHNIVEHSGRNTHTRLFIYMIYQVEKLDDTLSRKCGHIYYRGIRHIGKSRSYFIVKFFYSFIVLILDCIICLRQSQTLFPTHERYLQFFHPVRLFPRKRLLRSGTRPPFQRRPWIEVR